MYRHTCHNYPDKSMHICIEAHEQKNIDNENNMTTLQMIVVFGN